MSNAPARRSVAYRSEWIQCPWDQPENLLNPLAGEQPPAFAIRLVVNPSMADVRNEIEAANAWTEGRLTEQEYLEQIAWRLVDWNLTKPDKNGEPFPIAVPKDQTDPEAQYQAWLQMEQEHLSWVVSLVRYYHLPKVRAVLLRPPGTTDSTTQTESQTEPTSTPPAA